MTRISIIFLAVGIGGCFAPRDGLTDEMPEDLPAPSCEDTDTDACASSSGAPDTETSTTGGGSSTAAEDDGCQGSQSCLGDDACVADWDAQSESRGPFACRFTCVPLLDETSWCSDDASCCDVSAECTARGYCVVPESAADDAGSSSGGSTG